MLIEWDEDGVFDAGVQDMGGMSSSQSGDVWVRRPEPADDIWVRKDEP